jgi:3-hydroxy-9,10-secoandrosta-1,3,5(10)-triene-9,17-dione monooxygenase
MLGGMVHRVGEPPEHRMFLVPCESHRIIDNWHVMGLRATGSKDVELDDLFVPEHYTVSVEVTKGRGDHPGAGVNPGALFRIPVFATFPYCLTGIPLGIAQAACELFLDGARGRIARYSGKSVADMTAVQIRFAEASACVDTARLIMRHRCEEAQAFAERHEMPDLLTKAAWRRDGAFAAGLCERAVEVLFKSSGGAAIFDRHPLERLVRDVHAATAHISMIWDAQATTFGRVAFGLPCDNPTI